MHTDFNGGSKFEVLGLTCMAVERIVGALQFNYMWVLDSIISCHIINYFLLYVLYFYYSLSYNIQV